jgi:hypothetical protein
MSSNSGLQATWISFDAHAVVLVSLADSHELE